MKKLIFDRNRRVGIESRRTYNEKIDSYFFDKYMLGKGCEIGYKGGDKDAVTILQDCDGYDTDTPGYDGKTIPATDGYYDYLYSSHCLEHIEDYKSAIREWFRVVRPGGHIVTVVPHRDLYERKLELPSKWNGDHKRFYTPASLLKELEDSLPINSFRVRHLQDNDAGHIYGRPVEEHASGQYEIEVVIQKL